MEKVQSEVNICMITDENFIMPTSVAIHSMIVNKKSEKYNFYIITSNVSDEFEEIFKNYEREDVSVTIIRENAEKHFNGMHSFKAHPDYTVTLSALLKFIIPELLPELDKVLYLDGDIIVESDLEELYSTDLEDNYAAAVIDCASLYKRDSYVKAAKKYFNSGVMLLNLNKLRENNVSKLLIEAKSNLADFTRLDQNIFNLVFGGKVKFLPLKYNFTPLTIESIRSKWNIGDVNAVYNTEYKTKCEALLDSQIIHYASAEKPWIEPNGALGYRWKHYYLSLYGTDKPERKEKYAISVVIPCYNTKDYLLETLDTIFNQTFQDFEIVLIDDGSTDGTAEMIEELSKKHNNISAYFQTNHGQGYERNFGVTKAQGKYIHFMDSDDLLDSDCFEKVYAYAEENDLDCVLFEGKSFYETKALEEMMPQYKTTYSRKEIFPKLYSGEELFVLLRNSVGMIVQPGMQLVKRDFLIENDVNFPALKMMEDNLYVYKVITRASKITVLPNAFYHRRVRENSTMTIGRDMDAVNAFIYTVAEIIKEYDAYKDNYPFSMAIFQHIVLQCKQVRTYYNKICEAERKDDCIDMFGENKDALSFCLFIAGAGERSAMCSYTTTACRALYSKLTKAYSEKSELNAKLQQTYKEKSELNAKLQQTYKEKSAKTRQIKRLEKFSLYPLLRKIKRFLLK